MPHVAAKHSSSYYSLRGAGPTQGHFICIHEIIPVTEAFSTPAAREASSRQILCSFPLVAACRSIADKGYSLIFVIIIFIWRVDTT